ncbi:thioesterase family protein [Alkalihalobacillus sp. AL-G]|uniref:thioesterase family protein n=1 Tax=Alkalihalobacillus sp. AL-G TaxID=2926399 RepID=UPI00272A2E8D|nr:thioesterase family protein [Alkalihalobacillus sp. AL-G]WLD95280.1 acyl-CoA thioesterase [Alkalihalobacillus sp. AL-G]
MFKSKTMIDVRYAETDQMGVVHHATYLIWFEVGRTQFIKDLGFSYAKLESEGILSPVTDITISYKKPFRYGQQAEVHTWLEDYTGIRAIYGYGIYDGEGELCIKGTSTHTCVDKESFKPIMMKKRLPEWHMAYSEVVEEKGRS